MRYTTSRRYEAGLREFLPVTTLHLDCQHIISYYGSPESAEARLRDQGGSVAGHISRCKECTGRQQALVQDNIRQAREQWHA